jgi:HEAT repeat protein
MWQQVKSSLIRSLRGYHWRSNRSLVEKMATDEASDALQEEILSRGKSIVPDLIWSLDRPEFLRPYGIVLDSKLTLVRWGSLRRIEFPILAIIDCLGVLGDHACISKLATLVHHPFPKVRSSVAEVLLWFGSTECIEPLRVVLADSRRYAASDVAYAIFEAAAPGRLQAHLRDALFEPLLRNLDRDPPFCFDSIIACLAVMDEERAVSVLTAPGFVSPARKSSDHVLRALIQLEAVLPEAALLDLIARTESSPQTEYTESLLREALHMLGFHDSPTARAELLQRQHSPAKTVRIGAWTGLLRLEGLRGPLRTLTPSSLITAENADVRLRTAARIRDIIDQVADGGCSQWYVNGFGHEWKETRDALLAVGATHSIRILDRTLSRFGPQGPPTGRDFFEALTRIHAASKEPPWEQESRDFGTDPDDLEVLLLKYMIEHKEVFGRKP